MFIVRCDVSMIVNWNSALYKMNINLYKLVSKFKMKVKVLAANYFLIDSKTSYIKDERKFNITIANKIWKRSFKNSGWKKNI